MQLSKRARTCNSVSVKRRDGLDPIPKTTPPSKEVRLKRSLLVLFIFALLCSSLAAQQNAAPKPAASRRLSDSVNGKLPPWFSVNGEYRIRLEGIEGIGFKPDNKDAYVLGRLRLNVTLKPTSWLKFQIQGQDAQVGGKNSPKPDGPPFEDTMDLRMAYAELGDAENQTFGLRAGRQELVFGEQRLVGHVSWLNTARTFDAVHATYRHDGVRIDAFAASVVNVREGEFNKTTDGNNFHGVYTSLTKFVPKATVEPYVFWRLAPRLRTESGASGNLDFKTIGLRWAGKLPARFDYGMEVVGQKGSLATDDVSA
jgi:hypothetical protein